MPLFALILTFICLLQSTPLWAADAPAPAPAASTATTTAEAELGKKTAEQIEKEYKLVKDDALVAKLTVMAADIAPFSKRPDVVYTCKVLDTPALNAMVIPGGTIYFTKGLIDAVESDHELAGVMAHEIAHNALYHAKKMMEREARITLAQILTTIPLIYLNKQSNSSEVSSMQLITMSELVKRALQNGYSVDLEIEADTHGVQYLHESGKYNPLGLYSVILGFRQIERTHATRTFTYLNTHPFSDERQTRIERKFKELGITINLWPVVNFQARVLPQAEGQKEITLALGTQNIVSLSQPDEDMDAKARLTAATAAINRRLAKAFIKTYDVDKDLYNGKAEIRLGLITVFALTKADADAAGMSLEALGAMVVDNIKTAISHERVKHSW